jgi:hypothetical protein
VRILLIAPTTRSEAVAACGIGWDRVVDLGIAGHCSYRQWSNQLQCRVDILPKTDAGDFQRIRALFFSGFGRMMDDHGLDWWELLSLDFHQKLEQILRVQKLAKEMGPRDDVFVTQPCFEAAILNRLLHRHVRYVSKGNAAWDRVTHYASVASKFSVGELWQILGDKYDAGYRFRSYVAQRKTRSERPVILLPSAYVNASRMLTQYATALPELDFLLVATRNSGRVASFPGNVRVSSLASYARATSVREEYEGLLRCWHDLKIKLRQNKEFALLFDLGALDAFPKLLSVGLEIRNAWINVFADEPISSD